MCVCVYTCVCVYILCVHTLCAYVLVCVFLCVCVCVHACISYVQCVCPSSCVFISSIVCVFCMCVGRTMLKIHRGTPCYNIHPQAWYTTSLKNLTAKWSWYRRSRGYRSSILDFLEQLVGERACNIVFKFPAQVHLQKVEDGRVVATAATVPRPFCCQSCQKCGVPCSKMNILAGCTTMNFWHGTPNAMHYKCLLYALRLWYAYASA